MTYQIQSWEHTLLSLAYEGHQPIEALPENLIPDGLAFDPTLLRAAYHRCDEITAKHSRSFHLASGLLPSEKRHAVRALYAFCRISDDIVDCFEGDIESTLQEWKQRIMSMQPARDDLVAVAWTHTRQKYRVPQRYAEQLIDGVARDLHQTRYDTFEELASYCYGVASTVGLMSMHIVGYCGQPAIRYAVKLGVALQLTNILRDVGDDWRAKRLYLPQEELHRFGVTEEDLDRGLVTEQWRNLMRFQIERNRGLYAEALPGIAFLAADGRFAIAAAAEIYRGILNDIEQNDYDVFSRRAHVSTLGKLSMLPGIWWRSRRATTPSV